MVTRSGFDGIGLGQASSTVVNFNGIGLDSARNLAFSNKVSGSSSAGIAISGVGAPSIVWQNTVLGSGTTDMSDATLGCDANVWGMNNFVTDLVAAVPDGGPGVGCIQ